MSDTSFRDLPGWTVTTGHRATFIEVAPVPAVQRRHTGTSLYGAENQRLVQSDGEAVFVDISGRRGLALRLLGLLVAAGCIGFAAVLWFSVVDGTTTAPTTTIPASIAPSR